MDKVPNRSAEPFSTWYPSFDLDYWLKITRPQNFRFWKKKRTWGSSKRELPAEWSSECFSYGFGWLWEIEISSDSGDPIDESMRGVKMLSEKTGNDDNF